MLVFAEASQFAGIYQRTPDESKKLKALSSKEFEQLFERKAKEREERKRALDVIVGRVEGCGNVQVCVCGCACMLLNARGCV